MSEDNIGFPPNAPWWASLMVNVPTRKNKSEELCSYRNDEVSTQEDFNDEKDNE